MIGRRAAEARGLTLLVVPDVALGANPDDVTLGGGANIVPQRRTAVTATCEVTLPLSKDGKKEKSGKKQFSPRSEARKGEEATRTRRRTNLARLTLNFAPSSFSHHLAASFSLLFSPPPFNVST